MFLLKRGGRAFGRHDGSPEEQLAKKERYMIEYPKDFLEFWKAYPRRVAKIAAFSMWQRALKKFGATPQELIEGAKRYADHVADKEQQFIKHPASWIGAGCWEDEYETEKPSFDGNSQWKARVGAWRKSKFWPEMWGPKPGEEGCQCPQELLSH